MPLYPQTSSFKHFKKSLFFSNPKSKGYLELILTTITIIFFSWFAAKPTLVTITGLLNQINSNKDTVQKLDQKIDSLVAADTTYRSAEERLYLLNEALPSKPKTSEFVSQIEKLSDKTSVEIKSFNFESFSLKKTTNQKNSPAKPTSFSDETKPSNPWLSLTFTLTATGEYSQLRQFLLQIHQLRRIVLIEKVNFNRENSMSQEQLTLKLVGKILYL